MDNSHFAEAGLGVLAAWQDPRFLHTRILRVSVLSSFFLKERTRRHFQTAVYTSSVVVVNVATNSFSQSFNGVMTRWFAELKLEGIEEGFLMSISPRTRFG